MTDNSLGPKPIRQLDPFKAEVIGAKERTNAYERSVLIVELFVSGVLLALTLNPNTP
jgi:hypothetical protein